MGAPIPVGGSLNPSAVAVSTTASKPYQLSSAYESANTVYIGTDPSVSDSNYVRQLIPGESFTWTEINLPVYAWCKPGQSAQLVVAYEATGSSSPGRTTVGLRNIVDLIEDYDVTPGLFIPAGTTFSRTFSGIDVSDYASVLIAPGAFVGVAEDVGLFVRVSVYFTPNAPDYVAEWLVSGTGAGFYDHRLQVPVGAETVNVVFEIFNTTAFDRTILFGGINIGGSTEPITVPRYRNYVSDPSKGDIPLGGVYSNGQSVVASYLAVLNNVNGPAVWSLAKLAAGAAASGLLQICTGGNNLTAYGINRVAADVNNSMERVELILPMRPVRLNYSVTVAGLSRVTLAQ